MNALIIFMGKKIQKIGLGSVQFGTSYGISNCTGQTTGNEVSEILKIAKRNGVRIIDTASAYGNAEKILGENDLRSFKIVSKFMPPGGNFTITAQLQESLENLGISALYGYLAHRPRHFLEHSDQWNELQSLKNQGIVKKTGFSLNSPEELIQILDRGIKPDLVQVPYNYFDRRFKDLMISLQREGCEIHTRSTFLQGLFFMDIEQLGSYFDEIKPILKYLQENLDNLPGALLNFVMSQPFVDTVIIGVENSRQFTENLNSTGRVTFLPDLEEEISESILIPSNWPI